MAIQPSEMKSGLVVRDTKPGTNPNRALFRLRNPHTSDGPWPAEHCSTGAPVVFNYDDLDRLIPIGDRVICDVNLTALVGRKVEFTTTFGSVLHGKLRAIEHQSIVINGELIEIPTTLVLDSERYRLEVVKSIAVCE